MTKKLKIVCKMLVPDGQATIVALADGTDQDGYDITPVIDNIYRTYTDYKIEMRVYLPQEDMPLLRSEDGITVI